MSSWRDSTKKVYMSIISNFINYCSQNNIDCLNPSVAQGVNFLAHMFHENASYTRLLTARSALSSFIFDKDFGSHTLVNRFLKGAFEKRPKFKFISLLPKWDAGQVIDFISSWHPNVQLNLKELTLKCCFLLILLSGQRCQTMTKLYIDNIIFEDNACSIIITELLKHSRAKRQQEPLYFKKFEDRPEVCVFECIKQYLIQTKNIRGSHKQLFISFVKPHKPVGSETISRWVKHILNLAGINCNITAHSTRSVSASTAAATGVPIDQILKTGGWARESTFTRFYKKEVKKDFCTFIQGIFSTLSGHILKRLVFKNCYPSLKSSVFDNLPRIPRLGNN